MTVGTYPTVSLLQCMWYLSAAIMVCPELVVRRNNQQHLKECVMLAITDA